MTAKQKISNEMILAARRELKRRAAKTSLAPFVTYTTPGYILGWVHAEICETLDQFLQNVVDKKSPRLIICMPPRSGKSQLVSRSFPAYALGRYPDLQLMAVSYSADLSSRFNRDVQRIIDSPEYAAVFPDTTLAGQKTANAQAVQMEQGGRLGGYIRTSDLFEIVGHKGSYRSTGVGGGLTGMGAECLTPDTLIATPRGNISIIKLSVGSPVISYNTNTNQLEICFVEAIQVKYAKSVNELHCNSGRSLKCTGNHPIFTAGKYTAADLLAEGAPVLCYMREGVCDPGVRVPQENQKRPQISVLFKNVLGGLSGKKLHGSTFLQGLREACRKVQPILFRMPKTSAKMEKGHGGASERNTLRILRKNISCRISWTRKICAVLFNELQERRSFSKNERIGKCEIQEQRQSETLSKIGCERLLCGKKDCAQKRRRAVCSLWGYGKSKLSSCGFGRNKQQSDERCKTLLGLSQESTRRRDCRNLRTEFISENKKLSSDKEYCVVDLQISKCHNFFANGILVHNCLIIDDPLKDRAAANSLTIRNGLWDWYTSTAYTRLSAGGGVIVMCTRWHQDDLIGRLLSEHGEPWHVINYPAIAEHDEPHRKKGEALHPERFDLETLERIKLNIGSHDWAALYQQHPLPEGGALFRSEWLQTYDDKSIPPKFDSIIGSWDMTFKDSAGGDYVVGTIWGTKGASYYLLDLVRGQWDFVKTLEMFEQLQLKWPRVSHWLIEDKANGSAIISTIKKSISGVIPITPTESKLARANAVSALFEAGNVYIPAASSWVEDYKAELLSFPSGAHDDQVDSSTQALNYLKAHKAFTVHPSNLRALHRRF